MNVYALIAAVSADVAKTGIEKNRKNEQQGYKFRGVDDVYNVLAPVLARHGLVILPRMLSRECVERQTQRGNALFYITVEAEFDFVSAHDGSRHTARTYGEAMDSGDKGTNKAMSAAYKYVTFQTFCIPTEGDHDADAQTVDPIEPLAEPARPAKPPAAKVVKPPPTTKPPGFDAWWPDIQSVADEGPRALTTAWNKSAPDLKAYAEANHRKELDDLKAVARTVVGKPAAVEEAPF
jgi:ERF superfamily